MFGRSVGWLVGWSVGRSVGWWWCSSSARNGEDGRLGVGDDAHGGGVGRRGGMRLTTVHPVPLC